MADEVCRTWGCKAPGEFDGLCVKHFLERHDRRHAQFIADEAAEAADEAAEGESLPGRDLEHENEALWARCLAAENWDDDTDGVEFCFPDPDPEPLRATAVPANKRGWVLYGG